MTFYELGLLTERWRMQQAREDRRAALSAWILASVHRNLESQPDPFDFIEVIAWLGHGFERPRAAPPLAEPPTADEVLERAKMLNQLYNSAPTNGTRE